MQRDVKIGVVIGVLVLALIVVFWWMNQAEDASTTSSRFGHPATVVSDDDVVVPPAGGSDVAIRWDDAPQPVPDQGNTTPPPVADVTTPEPPPMGNPPPPTVARKHVVQKGDRLIPLARKYYNDGRKWKIIHEANRDKIKDPNVLPIGAELIIPDLPASASSTAVTPSGDLALQGVTKHTVKKGDTYGGIAKQYYGSESKWSRIFKANKHRAGDDPKKLKVGIVLVIPADDE